MFSHQHPSSYSSPFCPSGWHPAVIVNDQYHILIIISPSSVSIKLSCCFSVVLTCTVRPLQVCWVSLLSSPSSNRLIFKSSRGRLVWVYLHFTPSAIVPLAELDWSSRVLMDPSIRTECLTNSSFRNFIALSLWVKAGIWKLLSYFKP